MKRMIFGLFILFALAGLAAAQDVVEGPSIEPTTLEAILLLVGGGIVTTITQLIKSLTKATGTLARIITGLVAVLATGAYFLIINPPFELARFGLYAIVIFGQATGYYYFYKKEPVE